MPHPALAAACALALPATALAEPIIPADAAIDLAAIEVEVEGGEIEDLAIEIEVVGGVEAAAEPAREGEAGETEVTEEESKPLPPGDSILADLDFDPTDESYAEKVAELFLDEEQLQEVTKQIADLDAEDFRLRNEASKRLAMVQAPVEHLLGEARDGAGIEMSRRIQGILNVRVKQRRLDALYHAAAKIATDGEPGFVGRLLAMAGTFQPERHWDLLRMMEWAVAKSAREQDEEALEAALASGTGAPAEVAAFALGYRQPGAGVEGGTKPDIFGGSDVLRLAHARGRVAAGDASVLAELVKLLDSAQIRVRHEAALLLRLVHGLDFGFAAYDKPEARRAAAARWANFAGSVAGDLEVSPLLLGTGARGEFRVLVGKKPGKDGAVLAFTTSGKNLGEDPLSSAMGGINPNRIAFDQTADLIVASGGAGEEGRVAVFSSDGIELWNASGIPAGGGCAPEEGGRLLVAIGSEVEEIGVTGDRIGLWSLGSETVSFGRLREGRFLCVHPDRGSIAEYGDKGKLLWERDGFHAPQRVERLPNGNLLVVVKAGDPPKGGEDDPNAASVGPELLELSADGSETVAKTTPKSVKQITSAARLPNGNTLVGTEKGLAEYTPEGYAVKVWLKNAISSLHVR